MTHNIKIDMMLAMKKEDLMTRKEVMEYLRISHQTLHKLMKQRAFPYIKLEKRVLFKKTDIDKYIEAHIVPSKSD